MIAIGCSTPQTPSSQEGNGRQVPAWAVAISEPVELIPASEDLSSHEVTSPSSFSSGSNVTPRGLPRDLTGPVSRPASNLRDTASLSRSQQSARNADHRVIVNIHRDESNAASEPTLAPEAFVAPLERLYRGEYERNASRNLVQFGYDYFQNQHTPAASGPVPADYRLGAGDEILIAVTGSFEAYYRLEVSREGTVVIPDVGAIPVADLRYDQLADTIDLALKQVRKGYQLSVSLGRIRSIRVHVVGEVARPGMIEISARANILDVLASVGGPKKTGSLRNISWKRDGRAETSIDLYDFLVGVEEPPRNVVLAGDVIHVPPIGKTIGVAGYVQRPGIYEMSEVVNLDEALRLAGGTTPFTFTPYLQIERTSEGRGRETVDVLLDDASRQRLIHDGEILIIGAVDDRLQPIVQVSGEVVRPGEFQYRSGLRVSELITLADGLTIDAFLPQAFISRQVGTPGSIELVAGRKSLASSRRVIVVDLEKALAQDAAHDLELLPLDHLSIRPRSSATVSPIVEIMGAVQKPGAYELTVGLRVSELIALADNVTPDVYYDEAELIRRVNDDSDNHLDVKRYRFNLRDALDLGGKHDPLLKNGDRLVIRKMRKAEIKARIEGQVRFPGEYVFPADAKITDLIAAAGGLADNADLRAAVFSRESVKQLQNSRFNHLSERTQRLFEDSLRSMVQSGRPQEGLAAKLALQDTEQLVDRMRRQDSNGRIVIPFNTPDFPSSPYNLALEPGDRLVVPRRQETVAVIGCVFTPNSFVAEDGLTVMQALDRVGGTTDLADQDQVYVIRADGNVESLAQKGQNQLRLSARLHPGDVVLVPREAPSRTFGAELADTLMIARRAAELGLIATQIGEPVNDFNFSSISDSGHRNTGINAYQEAILEKTRR